MTEHERIGNMTLQELQALIDTRVHELVASRQQVQTGVRRSPGKIPVLDLGPWPKHLELISRESFYDENY
jgi:hypothetical protein